MKRLDRLTAILTQLQTGRKVIAENLAERFHVSSRTIYRDIQSLKEAGIPVIGEAGNGYSMVEGFKVPPVMFSPEEVITFKMADKVIEKYTDLAFAAQFKSALDKITAVLRQEHKAVLNNLDSTVVIRQHGTEHIKPSYSNVLNLILAALHRKEVLKLTYDALWGENKTERVVEPVGIYLYYNYWYLLAWCRLRNDYRVFRTDRITEIRPTGILFSDKHPNLKAYLEKLEAEKNLTKVVIKMETCRSNWLATEKFNKGLVNEIHQGDFSELTFMVEYPEDIVRWVISFYDKVEIIEPAELDDSVRQLLKKMLSMKKQKITVKKLNS
jgi:predicted DNA-binding transcriptional regulator YafY